MFVRCGHDTLACLLFDTIIFAVWVQTQQLLKTLWVHAVPVLGGIMLCIALWTLILSAVCFMQPCSHLLSNPFPRHISHSSNFTHDQRLLLDPHVILTGVVCFSMRRGSTLR
jgi:hypothetical protein